MEIIFRGFHNRDGKLVAADVLQLGRRVPIQTIFDGERDWAVQEVEPMRAEGLPVRLAMCEVIYPGDRQVIAL